MLKQYLIVKSNMEKNKLIFKLKIQQKRKKIIKKKKIIVLKMFLFQDLEKMITKNKLKKQNN